jgi:glyoxylase I family protein
MLKPKDLHHAAIRVTDVERARDFYTNVLGFKQIPRPDVDRPGAWLSLGNAQVHLIHGPTIHADAEPGMATKPHIAIVIDDFPNAGAELERHGIQHRVMIGTVAGSIIALQDPDGNAIELRESY